MDHITFCKLLPCIIVACLCLCTQGASIANCPDRCSCRYAIINKDSLDVNCAGAGLNQLPLRLPEAQTYRLYMAHNNISHIDSRSYLANTDFLDISDNHIDYIKEDMLIGLLKQVRYLYLHDNDLHCLPSKVKDVDFAHIHEMSLHGNPWKCACVEDWMPKWVMKHEQKMKSQHGMSCTDEMEKESNGRVTPNTAKSKWKDASTNEHVMIERLHESQLMWLLAIMLLCSAVIYVCTVTFCICTYCRNKRAESDACVEEQKIFILLDYDDV